MWKALLSCSTSRVKVGRKARIWGQPLARGHKRGQGHRAPKHPAGLVLRLIVTVPLPSLRSSRHPPFAASSCTVPTLHRLSPAPRRPAVFVLGRVHVSPLHLPSPVLLPRRCPSPSRRQPGPPLPPTPLPTRPSYTIPALSLNGHPLAPASLPSLPGARVGDVKTALRA
jgi:hypothetical protein